MDNKIIANALKQNNKNAVLALQNGDYVQALAYFEQSRELEESLHLFNEAAKTQMNIANTLFLLKKYDEAYENAKKAFTLLEKEEKKEDFYQCCLVISKLEYLKKEYFSAIDTLQHLKKKCKSQAIIGECNLLLYQCYMSVDNSRMAQNAIDKCIQYYTSVNDKKKLIYCLHTRSEFFKKRGNLNLALLDNRKIKMLEEE